MSKGPVYNPYLPSWEYVPDGEPHVFGERLYLFGSHDRFGGKSYCENDYVCWSAPLDDLSDWRFEGTIYRKDQDPRSNGKRELYAPDVTRGADGRYYLYYSVVYTGIMSVAVSDTPCGKYEYYGDVHYADGSILGDKKGDMYQFDPGVLVDDDGRVYLFSGWSPPVMKKMHGKRIEGPFVMELEQDMLTIRRGPQMILPKKIPGKGLHSFFEASSIRKFHGKYYFIYSSQYSHELCYCMSEYPMGPYEYKGVLHSNGNKFDGKKKTYPSGNNHGSIEEINGKYYIFGHRHTNRNGHTRQGVAEQISMNADGTFSTAEMTSCGLNGGPLPGIGKYPAYIACQLTGKHGCPYITQEGADREGGEPQYVAGIRNHSVVGYRYFAWNARTTIALALRGHAEGTIQIFTTQDHCAGSISLKLNSDGWKKIVLHDCDTSKGTECYLRFSGKGSLELRKLEFM